LKTLLTGMIQMEINLIDITTNQTEHVTNETMKLKVLNDELVAIYGEATNLTAEDKE